MSTSTTPLEEQNDIRSIVSAYVAKVRGGDRKSVV